MKKLYYYIRLPLGWILLRLRNICFTTSGWAMWWAIRGMDAALWFDIQGVSILPEHAPPGRVVDGKDVCVIKKNENGN